MLDALNQCREGSGNTPSKIVTITQCSTVASTAVASTAVASTAVRLDRKCACMEVH